MPQLLAPLLWACSSALASPSALVLAVGEQRWVAWEGVTSFTRGDPTHLDVLRPSTGGPTRGLLLRAKRAGVSDLRVWDGRPGAPHSLWVESRVFKRPWLSVELSQELSRLRETEVLLLGREGGPGVTLRGTVGSEPELKRIRSLSTAFTSLVTDETELTPELQKRGLEKLQAWIQRSQRVGQLRVQNTDGAVVLYGSARGPSDRAFLERRALSVFPGVRLALESFPDAHPTLLFKVYLLELKKSASRTLGLGWPASQEGAFSLSPLGLQSLLKLEITLHELETRGLARLLSRPELVVRTPGQAELFAGGELPIQLKTQFFSNVSWKTFGLLLKLKTLQATSDSVRLELQTEVSHLDRKLALHEVPGLQANRLKTEVDARLGEPLFLSGLLQEGTRHGAQGLPWLRSIPVLGLLFGSEDYLHELSELVAILVPDARVPRISEPRARSQLPRGPLPAPRDWVSPEQEAAWRQSADFPWNALNAEPTRGD